MYDSVRRLSRLDRTDMFNLAGRFDRRSFWIYASLRRLQGQLRLMTSLELLTTVEEDARSSFDLDQGGVNENKVP
jgi:hypothetical protein